MDSWPNKACITLRSAPPSRMAGAKEWRRVWGEMVLWMPAIAACYFSMMRIMVRVR